MVAWWAHTLACRVVTCLAHFAVTRVCTVCSEEPRWASLETHKTLDWGQLFQGMVRDSIVIVGVSKATVW